MKLQESERTEFKSIVVTDIKKEIIAFANCDGGKIYIGIEDDGTVIGVKDSDSVALQVTSLTSLLAFLSFSWASASTTFSVSLSLGTSLPIIPNEDMKLLMADMYEEFGPSNSIRQVMEKELSLNTGHEPES